MAWLEDYRTTLLAWSGVLASTSSRRASRGDSVRVRAPIPRPAPDTYHGIALNPCLRPAVRPKGCRAAQRRKPCPTSEARHDKLAVIENDRLYHLLAWEAL